MTQQLILHSINLSNLYNLTVQKESSGMQIKKNHLGGVRYKKWNSDCDKTVQRFQGDGGQVG